MSAPIIVWLRPGVGYVAEAAASMLRLEAALGRPHDCNSSYRDYNEQLSMWRAWQIYVNSGYSPSKYPGHSRALHPDASMHCKGLADDSDDWMTPGYIELAADHGWIRTAAEDPTERHHFEYQASRDNHRNEGTPAGVESEEFDMNAEQDAILRNIAAHLYAGGPSARDNKYNGGEGSVYNRLRNVEAHLYAGGVSAQDPAYVGAVGTVYNMLKSPVFRSDAAVPTVVPANGSMVKISQRQDNADTNTILRGLAKEIVDGVIAALAEERPGA